MEKQSSADEHAGYQSGSEILKVLLWILPHSTGGHNGAGSSGLAILPFVEAFKEILGFQGETQGLPHMVHHCTGLPWTSAGRGGLPTVGFILDGHLLGGALWHLDFDHSRVAPKGWLDFRTA